MVFHQADPPAGILTGYLLTNNSQVSYFSSKRQKQLHVQGACSLVSCISLMILRTETFKLSASSPGSPSECHSFLLAGVRMLPAGALPHSAGSAASPRERSSHSLWLKWLDPQKCVQKFGTDTDQMGTFWEVENLLNVGNSSGWHAEISSPTWILSASLHSTLNTLWQTGWIMLQDRTLMWQNNKK